MKGSQATTHRPGDQDQSRGRSACGDHDGQEIVIRAACKPIASIALEQETIDVHGNSKTISVREDTTPASFPASFRMRSHGLPVLAIIC